MNDEGFYAAVAEELEHGTLRKGLWTKALVRACGDKAFARVVYIELRKMQLEADERARVERAEAEEEARAKEAWRLEIVRQQRVAFFVFTGVVVLLVVLMLVFGSSWQ